MGLMIKQADERPRARSFCHSRWPEQPDALFLAADSAAQQTANGGDGGGPHLRGGPFARLPSQDE